MKHYDDVETDMPLDKMISVASALFELDTDDMKMHVVPGQGTMYYANGDRYVGGWQTDDRFGDAIYYKADGSKFMCYWADDKPQKGMWYYPDGTSKESDGRDI